MEVKHCKHQNLRIRPIYLDLNLELPITRQNGKWDGSHFLGELASCPVPSIGRNQTRNQETGYNQLNRLLRKTRGFRILYSVFALSFCSCGKQPKATIENELGLTKSVCVNTGFAIRGLAEFRSLKDDSLKIAIYGKKRVLILDAKNRDIVETLSFPNANGGRFPRLVDVDRDGDQEILYQGGGYDNIRLESKEGKVYWARNRKNFDWAVADDRNSSSSPRFYIGGDAGIECIDTKGLPVWQVNKQSRRLEIVHSPDEPNHLAVLVGNRDTRIEFYDDKGVVRKVFKTPRQISDFGTVEWPFGLRNCQEITGHIRFCARGRNL